MTYDELLRLATMGGGTGPDLGELYARSTLPARVGPQAPAAPQPLPLAPAVPVPPTSSPASTAEAVMGPAGGLERTIGTLAPAGGIFGLLDIVTGLARGGHFPSSDASKRRNLDKLDAELEEKRSQRAEARRREAYTTRIGAMQNRLNELSDLHTQIQAKLAAPGMSEDIAAPLRTQQMGVRASYNKLQGDLAKVLGSEPLPGLEEPIGGRKLPATQAEAKAAEKEALQGTDINDYATVLTRLNSDKDVQDFQTVRSYYASIQESAREPSAAGDLAVIFAFMKIVDPGSTVREGEQATAANARGVEESVRALYNRVVSGEKLSAAQRADFVKQAGGLYRARLPQYKRVIEQYGALADKFKLDKGILLRDYTVPEAAPARPNPNAPPNGNPRQSATFEDSNGNRFTLTDPGKISEARRRAAKQGSTIKEVK